MITTLEEYKERIIGLEEKFAGQDFKYANDLYRKDYLFFKAIINLYFGSDKYSNDQIISLFKGFLLQSEITILDRETDIKILFDTIKTSGDTTFIKNSDCGPSIYCSFHFGSFITAIPFLINEGVELYVVSKNEYLINELTAYTKMKDYSESKINRIDNNDWNSLINISNKLKEGKSVFVYIDRLDGTNIQSREKLSNLKFLNHELLIRRGIPEISYLRKAPIVSVICCRKSISEIEISFQKHLFSFAELNKQEYVGLVINDIFGVFSNYIKDYPEQWDYWLDLFHQIDLDKVSDNNEKTIVQKVKKVFRVRKEVKDDSTIINDSSLFTFNEDEYGIYLENDLFYLLNLKHFTCFKISSNLNNVLNSINANSTTLSKLKNIINPGLLNDLISKRVLQNYN